MLTSDYLENPTTPGSCRKLTSSTSTLLKRSVSAGNESYLSSFKSPSQLFSVPQSPASKRVKCPQSSPYLDRFIPNRQNIDYESCNVKLVKATINNDENQPQQSKAHVTINPKFAQLEILTPNRNKRMVDVFDASAHIKKPLGDVYYQGEQLLNMNCSSASLSATKKKIINRVMPSKPTR